MWAIVAQLVFNIVVTVVAVGIFGITGILFAALIILYGEIVIRRKFK